ncbi:MAG: hypothetical protein KTR31_26225 [Myxococcales bacterium]|nr:hypothetical protein [Myxococcales bacterium]
MTDLEVIGGREVVHRVMQDFVERVFGDFIIGYLFEGRDLGRIVQLETQLAVAHLGGQSAYDGRPLGKVHQPLRINRGHFRRRLAILATVLGEHGIDEEVGQRWLDHDRALEPVITDGTDCVPGAAVD